MTDIEPAHETGETEPERTRSELLASEDWWAVWFGTALLVIASSGLLTTVPQANEWNANPLNALTFPTLGRLVLLLIGLGALTGLGTYLMGRPVKDYVAGFAGVFALAVLAQVVGSQQFLDSYGLGYALWAIVIGLIVANTIGTPRWMLAGARSEMFIKTGLVLMGAEILFHRMVALGGPGLMVAWIVTPIVIVFMWKFGTRILRIGSPALVIVIACATSVCGVSAAIATAAAARARKEELTLAVSMTMVFTVAMMLIIPAMCGVIGLDQYVAGAWIGGTIDSTGAVVAAGALLGERAAQVAAVIKMIQNILIGLIAFLVALYWVAVVERDPSRGRPSLMELWYRFPKFVVGFLAASLIFSFALLPAIGEDQVGAILSVTKGLRSWWFCVAFVAIGLEADFRRLIAQVVGGRPIILYLVGQTFNILLTLAVAYLAFGGILFDLPG